MNKLLPILIFSLIMAFFSEKNSIKKQNSLGESIYVYKDWVLYFIMVAAIAIFVGLRLRGNDTFAYRHSYELFPVGYDQLKSINWLKPASVPGYTAFGIIVKTLGFSTQDYLMAYALFTVSVYYWFIRKYSNNVFFSVFLSFAMGIFSFTMAAIKQTAAMAILLIATDKAIQKKYVSFLIAVFIAMTFHAYAFVYLIIPFLDFKPWSRWTRLFLIGTIIAALSFSLFLSSILDITGLLGADYSEEEMTQDGVNVFRVLVVWVPVVLSFFVQGTLQKKNDRKVNIVVNATMINALIMFLGLFGTANYFARLANYFLIFQAISLPMILDMFDSNSRKLLKIGATVGFSGFFYYEQMLAHGTFDTLYDFMSFSDYFNQLLM